MALQKASKIWMNGKWVGWDDAKIHILSHVVHYASSVFEGIRCYRTRRGPAIFRLEEHMDRLMISARIYRMDTAFTREQIRNACLEAVSVNDLEECYIRPLIYRGYENLGVNPFGSPVEVAVAAFAWGKYLGDDALTKGVAVKISSWWRISPNTLPAMAKASANYMNSQLMKMEALVDGYGVREEVMPRELLYVADEVFLAGTAVEVTPVHSVDRIAVSDGKPGKVTRAIQEAFFGIVRGEQPDRHGWLTPVPQPAGAAAA